MALIVTLVAILFGVLLDRQWTKFKQAKYRTTSTQTEIKPAVASTQTEDSMEEVYVSPYGRCWHAHTECRAFERAKSHRSLYPCPMCAQ